METPRKKPPVGLGIIFCLNGFILLTKAFPLKTNWQVAGMAAGCLMILFSLVLNAWYYMGIKKQAKRTDIRPGVL
jgi:hypothetical protein